MSDYKIIIDSCADLNGEMKEELGVQEVIPFYMHIAGETLVDDEALSIPVLLQKMKDCTEKMTSSCGDPETWKNAFEKAKKAFAITISGKLSGQYAAAAAGLEMAKEDSGCEGYIFDSKSACTGETLLVYKLRELIDKGIPYNEIIESIESLIEKMRTFFVLDDISVFVKNGRLSHIKGTLIQILGIKPILGSNDGQIDVFGKVRGEKFIADKMVEIIAKTDRDKDGGDFVIAHCNNLPLVQEIVDKVKEQFNFGKIRITEMRGLSSFYGCNKGICMSF